MLKISEFEVMGWEHAIRGMRNPLNSWDKSDSGWKIDCTDEHLIVDSDYEGYYELGIGPNDRDLMKRLRNAGTDHRKFMRMITVYLDITAPLYWWKEFDTYKVGTVANSCSTMHKISEKKFEMSDFSTDHLLPASYKCLGFTVKTLNEYRECYIVYDKLKAGDIPVSEEVKYCIDRYSKKDIWWQMIQLLPSSYNQKRTVMLNYEVLANIYKSRRNHKLDEWHTFCDWIEELPYSEIITGYEEV